jgi:D-sedoheptulose 7-phosphate isomerase
MNGDVHEIQQQLQASATLLTQLAAGQAEVAAAMAAMICDCFRAGGKLLLCGNGGSAGDAMHVATELVGRYKQERQALPALALGTDVTFVTAFANDYSFTDVFSRQVEGLGRPGDVLWAFSTSGSSKNVLQALRKARSLGMQNIGFTGAHGRAMVEACNLCLVVPSADTPRIQEAHIAVAHIICDLVERAFAGE